MVSLSKTKLLIKKFCGLTYQKEIEIISEKFTEHNKN